MTSNEYKLNTEDAEKIRLIMREQRITQAELAKRIESHQATISAWLTFKQGTSLENYQRLYEALGSDPRLTFLTYLADKQYLSSQKERTRPYVPLEPLSLYFQTIESIYQNTPAADGKIRIIRSLDALVVQLEHGEK